MEFTALTALGTIADVVPLTGENRIIVRHGLTQLLRTQNPGLLALINAAGYGKDDTGKGKNRLHRRRLRPRPASTPLAVWATPEKPSNSSPPLPPKEPKKSPNTSNPAKQGTPIEGTKDARSRPSTNRKSKIENRK